MTKLQLENLFSTRITAKLLDTSTGEVAIQLLREPKGDFGFLIINYEDKGSSEEIFYHRKDGNTIYTYGINRENPKIHLSGSSVMLNDSAKLFNYITDLLPDHFFIYKTSETSCHVKGGKIFDEGVFKVIPDKTDILLSPGNNFLYVNGNELDVLSEIEPNKLFVGEIVCDVAGKVISHETYNVIGLTGKEGGTGDKGLPGDKGDKGDIGLTGPNGIGVTDGGTEGQVLVKNSNIDGDSTWKDVVSGGAPLPEYTIDNTAILRAFDRNDFSLNEIADVLGTLIETDIIDGLMGVDGVGVIPGGALGQVLAKKSSDIDYDMEWITPIRISDASVNTDYTWSSQKINDDYYDKTYTDDSFEVLDNKATDINLGTSDILYPSQAAVKAYVDALTGDETTITIKEDVEAGVPVGHRVLQAEGAEILYVNGVDNLIYKKNSADNTNGVAITNDSAMYPSISSNGQYLLYTNVTNANRCYRVDMINGGDGEQYINTDAKYLQYTPKMDYIVYVKGDEYLYRKDTTDTTIGVPITTQFAKYATVSPDSQYVYYSNQAKSGHLYRKNLMDNGNGQEMNLVNSMYPLYTNEGSYLYYVNADDNNYLYRKDPGEVSLGELMLSVDCGEFNISPDGDYIIYRNNTDGYIYKKTSGGTDIGTDITSVNSVYPIYTLGDGDAGYYQTDATEVFSSNFAGITNASALAGEDVKITVSGTNRKVNGLEPGKIYYLADTSGGVQTEPGTNSVQIGKCLHENELIIFPGGR